MCITGPSAGENRWMEVDGESRKAVGFPYPTGLSFTSRVLQFWTAYCRRDFYRGGDYPPPRRRERKAHWAFLYFTAPLITPLTTQRWAKT